MGMRFDSPSQAKSLLEAMNRKLAAGVNIIVDGKHVASARISTDKNYVVFYYTDDDGAVKHQGIWPGTFDYYNTVDFCRKGEGNDSEGL